MSDDDYMKDPRAKSVAGMIAGLTILSGYLKDGMATTYFCGGEHDIIYFYVSLDDLPEDSDHGVELQRLGFHAEDDAWGYFT